ncbi:copper resistance protein B [Leucothrix pacifica]|uniref:Copper resistance protein CopB n=1 Tax=Leucothrix pacifica TaxID=1247513 RepID=A0A317C2Q5_9GAMM|nr:copper resistance protein B [Leucothrix pacifica]PWQ92904.1 copper resistance protein CopB [Leucothrix pacifica]
MNNKSLVTTLLSISIGLVLAPTAFAGHKGKVDCTKASNAKVAACLDPAVIAKAARIKAAKARMAKMAKKPAPAMDHSKMKGMDHSKMPGMDHSKMKGMDHSKMEGMDHSKMEGMDHSNMEGMDHSNMEGMDHSKMKGMDHSKMKGMDHSKMKGMDHSKMKGMDHSKMPGMAGMDHSKMEKKIPVSDGSMEVNIPLPYPGALHMVDDPFLTMTRVKALELGRNEAGTNTLTLEADAWLGYDLHKLWIKTDLEMSGGKLEEGQLQALYSRGISPYWDVQAGVRKDFKPVGREWAVVGMRGIAPYFFDIDASFAVGKGGQTNARFNAEYELMLTQKAVLAPELDLSFYGKDDAEVGVGSGLSQAKVGLRLGYQIKREFTPYIGVRWSKQFGNTADFTRAEGGDISDTQLVLGIEAWF